MLLPQVSCAFPKCFGIQCVDEAGGSANSGVALDEWALRDHILQKRKQYILDAAGVEDNDDMIYDTYREALAVQERKHVPAVGPAVDRRAFDATLAVYNDENIQALICA